MQMFRILSVFTGKLLQVSEQKLMFVDKSQHFQTYGQIKSPPIKSFAIMQRH